MRRFPERILVRELLEMTVKAANQDEDLHKNSKGQ